MRAMEMPLLRAIRTTSLILAVLALPAGLAEAKGGHGGGHGGGHHGGGHHGGGGGGHHGGGHHGGGGGHHRGGGGHHGVGIPEAWPTMEGVLITHQAVIATPSGAAPGRLAKAPPSIAAARTIPLTETRRSTMARSAMREWDRLAWARSARTLSAGGAIGAPALDMATGATGTVAAMDIEIPGT